jgi:hypothetical protein
LSVRLFAAGYFVAFVGLIVKQMSRNALICFPVLTMYSLYIISKTHRVVILFFQLRIRGGSLWIAGTLFVNQTGFIDKT